MIEGGIVPTVGTEVILQRGWIEVAATVVWSDGRRCGLEFEAVLSEDDFLTFRHPPLPIRPSNEAPTRRQWSLRDDPITPDGQGAGGRDWMHPAGRGLSRS